MFSNKTSAIIDGNTYPIIPCIHPENGEYYFAHYNGQSYIVEIYAVDETWIAIPKFVYNIPNNNGEFYRERWEYTLNAPYINEDIQLFQCEYLTHNNLNIDMDFNVECV